MQVRFYNAGNKIEEHMKFSQPEGGDIHFIAYWLLVAPKESWFEVPTEIDVRGLGIAVSFAKDIQQRFGARGVVRLDPAWDEAKAEGSEPEKFPLAANEEAAIEKAGILWKRYLKRVATEHLNDCDNIKTAGGTPRAAGGFTKFALETLGIQDPYDRYFNDLTKGAPNGNGTNADVKAILVAQGQMMERMMAVFMSAVTGNKLTPEDVKSAMGLKPEETLTSGVVTGAVIKPVSMRGAGPDADIFDRKVKSKAERSKEAAAAL